ncbi:13974_t:CDS:2 [Ambispora leptoticha]|uniref:13974_t:CDS:1 n=1 Tax=Ambispora leptoticha TaxID=144679 RepID=A0A9N9F635_9GLOM|nr:13974_t:CDS:2 [Ambispora leptoticha]
MNFNNQTNEGCPSPLLPSNGKELDTCFNDCCLPCPFPDNFYRTGTLDRAYKIFSSLGIVSFFLMLFLAVNFMMLPSAKRNPTTKQILLPFALSVCIFTFEGFFTVQQQESQCHSEIEQATIHNNGYCATQAFFELSGAYAIACWSSLLIVHLHLLSVWRCEVITRNIKFFHVIIWTIVILSGVIPMSLDTIASGNICFLDRSANSAFYYPLSFIYVVFILHLATCIYMANITIRANWRSDPHVDVVSSVRLSLTEAQRTILHVKTILRMQWRAIIGGLLMIALYLFDMIYFVHLYPTKIDTSSDWYLSWRDCIYENHSQDECVSKVSGFLPSYSIKIFMLFINRCAGIVIFIIFAAKKGFLTELYQVITGQYSSNAGSRRYNPSFASFGDYNIRPRSVTPNEKRNTNSQLATPELALTSSSLSSSKNSNTLPLLQITLPPLQFDEISNILGPPPRSSTRSSSPTPTDRSFTQTSSISAPFSPKSPNRMSFPIETLSGSTRSSISSDHTSLSNDQFSPVLLTPFKMHNLHAPSMARASFGIADSPPSGVKRVSFASSQNTIESNDDVHASDESKKRHFIDITEMIQSDVPTSFKTINEEQGETEKDRGERTLTFGLEEEKKWDECLQRMLDEAAEKAAEKTVTIHIPDDY